LYYLPSEYSIGAMRDDHDVSDTIMVGDSYQIFAKAEIKREL